jgi:hypothetical protein
VISVAAPFSDLSRAPPQTESFLIYFGIACSQRFLVFLQRDTHKSSLFAFQNEYFIEIYGGMRISIGGKWQQEWKLSTPFSPQFSLEYA